MSSALSQDHAMWKPQANPWMIAVSVMLGTFMEVLDTSIANVALPHIAGSMSITPDDATWVLTSYLISNAKGIKRHCLPPLFRREAFQQNRLRAGL